LKRKLLQLEVH